MAMSSTNIKIAEATQWYNISCGVSKLQSHFEDNKLYQKKKLKNNMKQTGFNHLQAAVPFSSLARFKDPSTRIARTLLPPPPIGPDHRLLKSGPGTDGLPPGVQVATSGRYQGILKETLEHRGS